MKIFKGMFLSLGWIVLVLTSCLLLGLLIASFFDYKPATNQYLVGLGQSNKSIIESNDLEIISWNIGYAGLDRTMDFFYEGGRKVRPAYPRCTENLDSITRFLQGATPADLFLLQEVDFTARRSYHINQVNTINTIFPGYQTVFAINYHVPFVPVPVYNPMGKVISGILSVSGFQPLHSERIGFPVNFNWPKRLFMFDRCYIKQHYNTSFNKGLVVINIHNSTFDNGKLNKVELEVLKADALDEYNKGNWVIIGGDWNMNPPDFEPGMFTSGDLADKNPSGKISSEFMPEGWAWAYDPYLPTNRSVKNPYVKGKTPTTILDYFLLSPGVELLHIKTIDLGFRNSDHNPVMINIRLKNTDI